MLIKMMETLLDNKLDNFKFLTSFSLDIRNCFVFIQWRMNPFCTTVLIKLSFFDVLRGYRKRHMWHEVGLSSRSEMFFRKDVLKHFTILKGKHLSWSLFLIKLQASIPAALLKRDCRMNELIRAISFLTNKVTKGCFFR